jgi:hypothetical protein
MYIELRIHQAQKKIIKFYHKWFFSSRGGHCVYAGGEKGGRGGGDTRARRKGHGFVVASLHAKAPITFFIFLILAFIFSFNY